MTFLSLLPEDGRSFPSLVALIKYIWMFTQHIPENSICSLRGRLKSFVPQPVGSALPRTVTCPPSLPAPSPSRLAGVPGLYTRARCQVCFPAFTGAELAVQIFSTLLFPVKSVRDA